VRFYKQASSDMHSKNRASSKESRRNALPPRQRQAIAWHFDKSTFVHGCGGNAPPAINDSPYIVTTSAPPLLLQEKQSIVRSNECGVVPNWQSIDATVRLCEGWTVRFTARSRDSMHGGLASKSRSHHRLKLR